MKKLLLTLSIVFALWSCNEKYSEPQEIIGVWDYESFALKVVSGKGAVVDAAINQAYLEYIAKENFAPFDPNAYLEFQSKGRYKLFDNDETQPGGWKAKDDILYLDGYGMNYLIYNNKLYLTEEVTAYMNTLLLKPDAQFPVSRVQSATLNYVFKKR